MAMGDPSPTGGARGRLERVRWEPSAAAGGPRSARTPVAIDAYVPAPLASIAWSFSSATTAAFGDAQAAITGAQQHANLVGTDTIARQLLRSESMASSQMEGVDVPGHRALAKADLGQRHRTTAVAAVANIDAVTDAYAWAAGDEPFTIDAIRVIHTTLAAADRWLAPHAGKLRRAQNWIGHNPNTPAGADFIPPPPEHVEPLLDDLCQFLNRVDLPPVAQAAIAHVQFETIHPFADGNGRVGRALIGASLIRSRLCVDVVPPISLVLARNKQRYIDALTAFRQGRDHDWLLLLAESAEAAARASITLADQVARLQASWREAAGRPRAGSAATRLIDALPANPMLNTARAAALTGLTDEGIRRALASLEAAGVLRQVTVGKRNRVWESVGLFALVDEMERTLSGGAIGAAGTAPGG